MANYSAYVGYVPGKLRLKVSGTITGGGLAAPDALGSPNDFFVSTAQGVSNTSSGVTNPGVCLNTSSNVFNIESGVTFISFQNVVAANGSLTITGEASGATITSVDFPKLEYVAGSISGVTDRASAYSFPLLKTVTGDIYLSDNPNPQINFSGLRSTRSLFIEYSPSGTVSGLDSLKQLISCEFPGPTISISGFSLNTYPYTPVLSSISNYYETSQLVLPQVGTTQAVAYYPFGKSSITILPSGSPTSITTSSNIASGDFLSGLKKGSVTFYSPDNFTEIKLAQNYLNPVPSGNFAVFNYIATTGVTGITFPPVSGYVYYMVTANSGVANGAPLNINVKTTGESGTLVGFAYQPRNITDTNRGVNITFSGYSAISGNSFFSGLLRNRIGVLPQFAGNSGGFCITANSSSGVFVSGNNLTRFFTQINASPSAVGGYTATFVNLGTGPLVYTATGNVLETTGSGSLGMFCASSGTDSTGIFNFLNATSIIGATTFNAAGVRSNITFNVPQLTGINAALSLAVASTGTSGSVVLNAPLLTEFVSPGSVGISALGTDSTGIVTLGNPGPGTGFTTSIQCTGSTGSQIICNTTGGPGQSGVLSSGAFVTTAGFCNFNLGDTARISGLRLTVATSGATTGTITGALAYLGNLNITGTSTGVSSSVVISGSNFSSGLNHTISGSGTAFTGIVNFTGNPSITGGTLNTLIINSQSGASITANYGNLVRLTGGAPSLTCNTPTSTTGSFVSLTATGLSNWTGNLLWSTTGGVGLGNANRIFYTGGEISGSVGNISISGLNGTAINFAFTGGPPLSGTAGSIDINALCGVSSYNTITGNLGSLATATQVLITGSGVLNAILPLTTGSLTATGLTNVTGSLGFRAISQPGATIFYTGAVQNCPFVTLAAIGAGTISGVNTGTINCIFTGVPSTGIVGSIAITGAWPETVITGTLNTIATIQTGVNIFSSGRAIITATGITTITGAASPSLFISGLTTSSVVSGIFPGLQTISNTVSVTISGSGGVSFSNLQVVSGAYIISGGSAAGRVDHGLSGLASLTGIGLISGRAQTIYLGPVNAVTGDVVLTGLKQIGNPNTIFNVVSGVVTTSGINNFDLRNVTGWYGRINVDLPAATGFNLSSVQFLGSNSTADLVFNQINEPALQFILGTGVTGDITFTGLQYLYHNDRYITLAQGSATGFLLIASGATSVSMPNIITGFLRTTNAGGPTTKTGWIQGASITNLSFGSSGITKQLFMNFTASGCPLNQASVDNILQTFASLDGTSSTTVYSGLTIRLNGLCAAPSATGSGYRTTLTGAGRLNTVLVN